LLIILGLVALGVALVVLWKKSQRFRAIILAVWNKVKSVTVAVWAAIRGAVMSAINAVLGFFRAFPGRAVSALRGLATTVLAFVTRWHPIAILIRVGRSQLPRLVGWLRGLPGRFVDALGGLANALLHTGRQAMRSLWDGLKALAGSILSWVGNLAKDIAGKLDPRGWFSTPEEHYRMLFGAAFRSIPDEARRALSRIEFGSRLVAEASVPAAPAGRVAGRVAPAAAALSTRGGSAVNIEGDLVVREELDLDRAAALFGRRLAVRGA
jgi:hypothetical protein